MWLWVTDRGDHVSSSLHHERAHSATRQAPGRRCPSRPVLARPRRLVRWCPGSCAVRLQGLQDHPPERGALADGAETRSTMQIAGDASYTVNPRARPATVLLIHDVFLLRRLGALVTPSLHESPSTSDRRLNSGCVIERPLELGSPSVAIGGDAWTAPEGQRITLPESGRQLQNNL